MTYAEIISIGDELLIGQTVNTNASWLGQELSGAGIRVIHTAVIADEKPAIVAAFDAAFQRADVILVTGGLGPTKDDITKHVLCEYFDTKLVVNEVVLAHVKSFFEKRNRPMLDVNVQQAALPENCEMLFNQVGTAAGMLFEKNGKFLISMPGVPYEMKSIFSNEALPRIIARFGKVELYHRTVLTQGIGESFLADKMSDWENRLRVEGFGLAYLPSPGMVKLRLTSYKGEEDKKRIDNYIQELKNELPVFVYGEGDETLAQVTGKLLRSKEMTVGTVESCTGGGLMNALTAVAGSSEYVLGGLITYSDVLKQKLASVKSETLDDHGAVSEETAREMAVNGRDILRVDWCISVTGIAGPGGGSDEKPVGLVWIAVCGPEGVKSRSFLFGDDRGRNVQMTVLSALNFLRCELEGINTEKKTH